MQLGESGVRKQLRSDVVSWLFILGTFSFARARVALNAWIAHSPDDIAGFAT